MARHEEELLLALAVVGLGGGLFCVLVWPFRRKISAPHPAPAGQWSAGHVVLAFFLMFLCQAGVSEELRRSGVLTWLYREEVERPRVFVWTSVFAPPLAVACILVSLYFLRGLRPAHVGITSAVWQNDVAVAYFGWLAVTAPLGFLYLAISKLVPVQRHFLERIATDATAIDWLAIAVSAGIMAPLLEETLFRGILLRWLRQSSEKSHAGVALAALITAILFSTRTQSSPDAAVETPVWAGPLHVVALWPGYLWLLYKRRRAIYECGPDDARVAALQTHASIYGSALLFAAFHAGVWPSPVPLFFLGFALGWVAQRTGTLVASFTLHALFNVVACVQLALPIH